MAQPDRSGDTPAPRFDIHFHDDHVAPAPAGLYQLTLEHEVTGDKVGSDKLPPVRQEFEIRAPQFTLDGSFVHALHPAPAAVGSFERVLPHITFNRLILPWERTLDPSETGFPWLALLLFAEEELPGDPKAQGHVDSRTVRDLLTPGDTGVLVPGIRLDDVPAELHDSTCTTIDVPAEVFAALVPRRADLPFLCHVRKVRDRQASAVRLASGEVLEVGDHSVVVANRFPRTAGRHAAHLVSLEGFADHVDGGRPEQSVVRLVSLLAWSFEARPDPTGHFDALVRRLAEDPAGLGLRLPYEQPTGARSTATERLDLGYAPVDYGLPSGERTFAWYRGPFTPVVAQSVPRPAEGWRAVDEALVYVADTGVFDVGYAVAFALGRALALSDQNLASVLSAFRSRARHIAGRALMRTATPLGAGPAHERFHELIEGGLGDRVHAAATAGSRARPGTSTPRRRAGGVPRPPAVETLLGDTAQDGGPRDSGPRERLRHALADHIGPLMSAVDQVRLLAAAPLTHLVPDARMLPPESLRFFHVDAQWCEALRDGVLSTGLGTSLDTAVNGLAREALTAAEPLAGLLMRSTLVRSWPDVIVEPRLRAPDGGEGELLDIVHRIVIGPDLLLCLFDGVPEEVRLREPHEGIHFGIDGEDRIGLRRLTEPVGESLGDGAVFPPTGEEGVSRFLRPVTEGGEPEVLDLAAGADPLVPALGTVLRAAGQLGPDEDLSPGAFAVELVNAPQRIAFTPAQPAAQPGAPSGRQ
ncbi:hypothetical protein [Streptomyces sp. NPDC097981]|uniref:hypothetical protein n=1 Tax=Streptomyces sp. NPDC097981 TaxID=3155428 RepID=UPI00332F65DC